MQSINRSEVKATVDLTNADVYAITQAAGHSWKDSNFSERRWRNTSNYTLVVSEENESTLVGALVVHKACLKKDGRSTSQVSRTLNKIAGAINAKIAEMQEEQQRIEAAEELRIKTMQKRVDAGLVLDTIGFEWEESNSNRNLNLKLVNLTQYEAWGGDHWYKPAIASIEVDTRFVIIDNVVHLRFFVGNRYWDWENPETPYFTTLADAQANAYEIGLVKIAEHHQRQRETFDSEAAEIASLHAGAH
jgi:hypothetical protein